MKTIIVTGADSGLGFETSKLIASIYGYSVILACRNPEKAEAAREKVIDATGAQNVSTLPIDTSSFKSIRNFVSLVKEHSIKPYCLINNAGISPQHTGTTEDGFELVFETNYLGPFLLTMLLLTEFEKDGRILNVSSDMHNPPGGLEWPGIEEAAHAPASDKHRYSYSKLCLLYFTYKLSDMLKSKGSGLCVNAFNPGFMADTNFSGGHGKERELFIKKMMPERYGTLDGSSKALAQLATDPAFDGVTGKYFDRSIHTAPSSELSYDTKIEDQVWKTSLEYCSLDPKTLQA